MTLYRFTYEVDDKDEQLTEEGLRHLFEETRKYLNGATSSRMRGCSVRSVNIIQEVREWKQLGI